MAGEFDTVQLGEVATVRSGFAFKSSDWTEKGVPVVKIANVKNGSLEMNGCSFVPQRVADRVSEFALVQGDILIAMTGYIGDVALVRPRDLPAVLNQRVGRFSIRDRRRLDKRFLYYLLREGEVRQQIEALGYGSAQPNVSPTLIHGVPVPLPSLAEQRAIAHILSTLDDKIELNRQTNHTLESMARALFKSWFVDFDPVWAKAEGRDPGLPKPLADLFPDRLVDSELGEIPEGWKVGTFGDVAAQLRENINPQESPDTQFRHFSIPEYDNARWPKREIGESIKSVKSRVPAGAVLLSKLNPEIERVWLVDVQPNERAICSTELVVLTPRAPLGRSYVYCLARSPLFRQGLEGLVTGTSKSHQRAQVAAVFALPILRPPDALVRRFESVAEPLLARSLGCRRESQTLAALRDALLPHLISGKIRLGDPERILANIG